MLAADLSSRGDVQFHVMTLTANQDTMTVVCEKSQPRKGKRRKTRQTPRKTHGEGPLSIP